MASSGSNLPSTKDVKIDGVKLGSNEECAKDQTHTVKTVDISQSAGQELVIKPVEIVHEMPAKVDSAAKKE